MATINERLLSEAVRHQVHLLRFANGETARIVRTLVELERRLSARLAARLVRIEARGRDLGPRVTARIEAMLREVRETVLEFFGGIQQSFGGRMRDAAKIEARHQQRMLQRAFASAQVAALPNLNTVAAIVNQFPIRGMAFAQWVETGADRTAARIQSAVRLGIVEGRTLDEIVRDLRQSVGGTAHGLRFLVSTTTNHVMTQARESVFVANERLLEGVQWVSTLDSRTTDICIQRDGNVYPVGDGPRPPAHGSCRSTTVAVIKGAEEFFGERASMFGPVPERVTYADWFKGLSAAQQNEIIGKTRGIAYRAGKITLADLADPTTGRSLTLRELGLLDG